ncbi:VWA domain-containing protein [Streptomyces lavenduligriseus]|uniref:VWA domain-containing protein n=1 Tax=Streptomyces lavenduligriseus TaxID=67315 RepID=A0ABT0NME7_9ACTN|nr:vWA domain-containing protein [Streptomyces lavenduligriseus]MCL3992356.1 VWA domain-containing protein [Streptomyces lavenduligriseus]
MTVAEETEVTLEVGQRTELPALPDPAGPHREREMHAILEIGVRGPSGAPHATPAPGTGSALAEVLIVDTSRSMLHPPAKLHAAKDATAAAVRMLPFGTAFAVLAGRFDATVVHPGPGRQVLAVARPGEREAAERAVRLLDADGGTAIGAWLDLARRLLKDQPAPVKHVLLLTDGRNEHDHRSRRPLETVLDACAGQFVCDAWGIGDDWDAELLLAITRRLHGRARAVRRESELTAAYEELIAGLLGTAVPELRIRLTPTTPGTVIRQVKQVVPNEQELQPVPAGPGGRAAEYVTRAWGDEVRHFQVVLTADPAGRESGEELQLAAVEIVVPGVRRPLRLPPPRPILVRWTDDPLDASRQHPGVRRHELYQRASAAVAQAYRAWLRGADGRETADRELARALALAAELGDAQLLGALRLIESAPGSGRIRPGLKDVDWQHLILSSALTTPPEPPSGEDRRGPSGAGRGGAVGERGQAAGVAGAAGPAGSAAGRPVAPGSGGPRSGDGGGEAVAGVGAGGTGRGGAVPGGAGRGGAGLVDASLAGSGPGGEDPADADPAGPGPDYAAPDHAAPGGARPGGRSADRAGTPGSPGPGGVRAAGADAAPRPGAAPPVRPDGLIECPECRWLGPADSVYCGGDCGRLLRGASA